MKYKISVDKDKCIGAASCIGIAPKTFKLEDDVALVVDQAGDDQDAQLLAAQSCPTGAIKITDQETGEQLWPKK
jgi:ferredoxin